MIRSVDQDQSTRSEPVFRAVRFPPEGSRLRPDIPTTLSNFCRANEVAETHSVISDYRSPPVESAWPKTSAGILEETVRSNGNCCWRQSSPGGGSRGPGPRRWASSDVGPKETAYGVKSSWS